MVRELKSLDISEMPALRALVEEIRQDGHPRLLRADGQDVAVLEPAKRASHRSPSRALPVTEDDPLFRLAGIGKSGKPASAAEHKHQALDEAYRLSHGP